MDWLAWIFFIIGCILMCLSWYVMVREILDLIEKKLFGTDKKE